MNVLGIETSCDETGVAIFSAGRGIVAEALSSQVELHRHFGGVVPELAARDHAVKLAPLVAAVVARSGLDLRALDAVAYTAGPGLIGALMVGGAYATALAYALGVPAVPVHHMEGHLLVAMLEDPGLSFPFLALLVSGGHTQLVAAEGIGRYATVGQTLDDAAGEAFDKVARLLGLGYPGGPAVAAAAQAGDAAAFDFPRPLLGRGLDFSFSGLKTAVRLAVESRRRGEAVPVASDCANIAASFELAVVDTLVAKCLAGLAQTGLRRLVVAGGVGANRALRRALDAAARRQPIEVFFPRPSLCTDNGAMIAYAGAQRVGEARAEPLAIVARPRWPLDELGAPDEDHAHG